MAETQVLIDLMWPMHQFTSHFMTLCTSMLRIHIRLTPDNCAAVLTSTSRCVIWWIRKIILCAAPSPLNLCLHRLLLT